MVCIKFNIVEAFFGYFLYIAARGGKWKQASKSFVPFFVSSSQKLIIVFQTKKKIKIFILRYINLTTLLVVSLYIFQSELKSCLDFFPFGRGSSELLHILVSCQLFCLLNQSRKIRFFFCSLRVCRHFTSLHTI